MTSLLPPNRTTAEAALEAAIARIGAAPVPISRLWSIDDCPADLLPWLAWSLSVDAWDTTWSEQRQRDAIRASVDIHRLRGTKASVIRALEVLDFRTEIEEWWQVAGTPGTVTVKAFGRDIFESGATLNAALVAQLDRLVTRNKPLHIHYTLQVGLRMDVTAVYSGGTRHRARDRRSATPAALPNGLTTDATPAAGTRHRARDRRIATPAALPNKLTTDATPAAGTRHRARHIRHTMPAAPAQSSAGIVTMSVGTLVRRVHRMTHSFKEAA